MADDSENDQRIADCKLRGLDFVSDHTSESSAISIRQTMKLSKTEQILLDGMIGYSDESVYDPEEILNPSNNSMNTYEKQYVEKEDKVKLLSTFSDTETQNEETVEVKNFSEDDDAGDFSPSDGSDFDPEKNIYQSDDSCEQDIDDEYFNDTVVTDVLTLILDIDDEYFNDTVVTDVKKNIKRKLDGKKKGTKKKKINSQYVQNEKFQNVEEEELITKGKENINTEENVKKKAGKRTWDRRNACFYCQELVTNFSRHLLRRHIKEIEVIEYQSIQDEDPKIRKKKRQEITDKLRNKGNFLHNCKVSFDRDEESTLLPCKRNKLAPSSPSTYATCKICLGTFKRSTFFRHLKNCDTINNEMKLPSLRKKALYNHSITIIPNTSDASVELRNNILPHLRSDEISLVVKNDPLIIAYGSRLLKKKKERRSRKAICSKMRDLATLLTILRKKDPCIETLTDVFEPEKYETFISAIKTMCGFNEQTGMVDIPSIPARMRPAILGCIDILYTQSIMSTESSAYKEVYKKKLDDFKRLIEINWQWEISSNAEKSRKRVNMTKQSIIPLDEDIATVMQRIQKMEIKYAKRLREDRNPLNYESLCVVTIAHIIMLDRKRAGDVAEAELTFYINRKNEDVPEKVLESLTSEQRKSVQELDVFQIPGKRTRAVPILLTKIMRENIDLIVACREDLNIPSSNRYLFARPGTEEPFDGGKCLEKIKKQCNLKRPEMLTSTGMRHHIATMSQIHAKQNDQYTEHLAGFLGHDVAVHARNYRLPLQVLQKAVVGTQLIEYENTRTENEEKQIETMTSQSDLFKDTLDETVEKRGKSSDVSEQPNTLTLIRDSTFETPEITTDNNVVAENEGSETRNPKDDEPKTKKYEESRTRKLERPVRKNNGGQKPKAKNEKLSNLFNHVPITNKTKVKQYRGKTKTMSLRFLSDRSIDEEKTVESSKMKSYEEPETNTNKDKKNVRETRTKKLSALTDSSSSTDEKKTVETSKTTNYEENDIKNKVNSKVNQNIRKTRTKKLSALTDSSSSTDEEKTVKTSKTTNYEEHDNKNKVNSKVNQNIRKTRTKKLSALTDSSSSTDEEKTVKTSKTTNYEEHDNKNKVNQNIRKTRTKKLSYSTDNNSDEEKVVIKRSKTTHRKWSDEEIKIVKKHFQSYINKKINPGKNKCVEVLNKEPALQKRTWMQLNTYVNNIYKKKL